jgi:hypothetical protein
MGEYAGIRSSPFWNPSIHLLTRSANLILGIDHVLAWSPSGEHLHITLSKEITLKKQHLTLIVALAVLLAFGFGNIAVAADSACCKAGNGQCAKECKDKAQCGKDCKDKANCTKECKEKCQCNKDCKDKGKCTKDCKDKGKCSEACKAKCPKK